MQAKVKSTTSHWAKQFSPNFSSINASRKEAMGFELSMLLSVPT
jgi:hypothetical protein